MINAIKKALSQCLFCPVSRQKPQNELCQKYISEEDSYLNNLKVKAGKSSHLESGNSVREI